MTNVRLDDLAIPHPPYRMKRPASRQGGPMVKLAAAESMPSNTPVLPPKLMQELEASVAKPEPAPAPGPTPAEKAAMTREHTKALEEDAIRTQVKKEMEAKAVPPPAEFHEEFPQPKETKEQEIHRLAKEALEKLNAYRSFTERKVGQGPPSPAETIAKERAAAAQRALDAARKPAAPEPKPIEEEPIEVGSETVYMPAVKEPPAPNVEAKPRPVETPKPAEQPKPEPNIETRPAPASAEKPKPFEIPEGVPNAKALLERVSQLGDPKGPGFMDRFIAKSGATVEDFLASVAMTFANRSKKKLEYRQNKIDEHIAKAKEAAAKGWIRGAVSGTYHEALANWHRSKGARAYRSQEHWHSVRGTYEDRRNEILEDLASKIDQTLETFNNRAEVVTYLIEGVDKRVQENRKKLTTLYAELAADISPERRTAIPGEVARINKELAEDLEIMTNYELRRGNIRAKANEQEELKDEILLYTETPARPDTTPKEPPWLKRAEPKRRRAPSKESKKK